MMKKRFTRLLLDWNQHENRRQMPWKGEKDPYKIWISEIILQQTRVEQGLNYYNRFVKLFPNVGKLASAPPEKVFKAWEGLGYYSRCRNLLASAQYINNELGGRFPEDYKKIISLKGVGPYTAAAIASFAFGLPHAVTDGNVYRVLSRVFGIFQAADSTEGKKYFSALAEELLDKKQPAKYNQAIMDFGATICKPSNPGCGNCIFNKHCYAFLNNAVNELPVKSKKQRVKKRWFYYLVIGDKKNRRSVSYAIRKRISRDIWQDLYEFPLFESEKPAVIKSILSKMEKQLGLDKKNYNMTGISPEFKQQLSHQLIVGRFISIELDPSIKINGDLTWVKKEQMNSYPFPQYINQFLSSHFPVARD
jgi:A/G-specific adenine glycosylase